MEYACCSWTPNSTNFLHSQKAGILNTHITLENTAKDLKKMLLVTRAKLKDCTCSPPTGTQKGNDLNSWAGNV